MPIETATYLDTSALEPFFINPNAFGDGPFVVSEYTLAEKTRLPWSDYKAFVLNAHAMGVGLLRVPPVTQLITGNLQPEWSGQIDIVPIDVSKALEGRAVASRKLNSICDTLSDTFKRRYAELRPHMDDWFEKTEHGDTVELIDPRPLHHRRALVQDMSLHALGWETAPGADDPVPDRLRWFIRSWETAMIFVRLERITDNESDLRNDPIDAVHYALAATFCGALATKDRGIKRIRELVPEPRCPLLFVRTVDGNVAIEKSVS